MTMIFSKRVFEVQYGWREALKLRVQCSVLSKNTAQYSWPGLTCEPELHDLELNAPNIRPLCLTTECQSKVLHPGSI